MQRGTWKVLFKLFCSKKKPSKNCLGPHNICQASVSQLILVLGERGDFLYWPPRVVLTGCKPKLSFDKCLNGQPTAMERNHLCPVSLYLLSFQLENIVLFFSNWLIQISQTTGSKHPPEKLQSKQSNKKSQTEKAKLPLVYQLCPSHSVIK